MLKILTDRQQQRLVRIGLLAARAAVLAAAHKLRIPPSLVDELVDELARSADELKDPQPENPDAPGLIRPRRPHTHLLKGNTHETQ